MPALCCKTLKNEQYEAKGWGVGWVMTLAGDSHVQVDLVGLARGYVIGGYSGYVASGMLWLPIIPAIS